MDDCDDIRSYRTKAKQTDRLVDLLISKGQKGFDGLVESILEEKTQVELAKAMNMDLEKEWHKTFSEYYFSQIASVVK